MADNSSEVKIKITAADGSAAGAFARVRRGMSSLSAAAGRVRQAVGGVMQTLARLNWAMMAVQTVIGLVQSLRERINSAATAARQLADQLARTSMATAAAHSAAAYAKLNKELAEANRLERERNAILDARKARTRDLEDARAEQDKQLELSRLDPNSETYEQDKAEIGRKYARRASERAAERAGEDSREGAKKLYGEADRIDRQADEVQARYERQMKVADRYREMSWQSAMAARGAGDDDDAAEKKEKAEKDHAEWEKAHDAAVKMREAMESLRTEAETLRNRAGEMMGGDYAARIRNEAEQARIDNEAREADAARRKREDDARIQLEQEREIAKLDPASRTYAAEKKEIERRYELKKIEREEKTAEKLVERDNTEKIVERDNTENTIERERADQPMTEAQMRAETERIRIENERRAQAHSEWKAERIKQDSEKLATVESALSSLADNDSVSQNRLTAMGLGSGVSATGGNRAELKEIIGLLKKQIDATKGIKTGKSRYEE